jgi:hypothetical protein
MCRTRSETWACQSQVCPYHRRTSQSRKRPFTYRRFDDLQEEVEVPRMAVHTQSQVSRLRFPSRCVSTSPQTPVQSGMQDDASLSESSITDICQIAARPPPARSHGAFRFSISIRSRRAYRGDVRRRYRTESVWFLRGVPSYPFKLLFLHGSARRVDALNAAPRATAAHGGRKPEKRITRNRSAPA